MDSLDIDTMTVTEMRAALKQTRRKLDWAVREIKCLDDNLAYLRKLLARVEKNKAYAYLYNLRVQMSIVGGVRVMYHHYAATREDQLNRLVQGIERATRNNEGFPAEKTEAPMDSQREVN